MSLKNGCLFPCLSAQEISSRSAVSEQGNCIFLKGSCIRVGEYVLCNSKVWQVIGIEDNRDIDEAELVFCGHTKRKDKGSRERFALLRKMEFSSSPRDPQKYNNVPASLMEAIECNEVEWVQVDAVEGIAFVFHFEDLHEGKCLCAGMNNAFGIRRSSAGINKTKDIACKNWDPWKSPYGEDYESHSKRTHNMLAALMESTFRALSFKGSYVGRNKHIHFKGASKEIMHCLTNGLGDGVITKECTKCGAKKRQLPNMAVCNKRMKTNASMVRLLTHDALSSFRESIGSVFGAAVDKAAPTMKEQKDKCKPDTVQCNEGDQVRILDCDVADLIPEQDKCASPVPDAVLSAATPADELEEVHPLLYKRPCPHAGLDVECTQSEHGLTDLHLNVKFKVVMADSEAVARVRFGGSKATADAGAPTTVVEGAMLEKGKEMYRVKSADLDTGRVKLSDYLSDSDKTAESIDIEEAKQLTAAHSNE